MMATCSIPVSLPISGDAKAFPGKVGTGFPTGNADLPKEYFPEKWEARTTSTIPVIPTKVGTSRSGQDPDFVGMTGNNDPCSRTKIGKPLPGGLGREAELTARAGRTAKIACAKLGRHQK